MKKILKKILEEIKKEAGVDFKFEVNYPADKSFGHYSTNYALALAKLKKENPQKLAEEVVESLKNKIEFSSQFKVQIVKPGFINFWIKKKTFTKMLESMLKAGAGYGSSKLLAGKKIMVEYAQPNPFKSFHVGHLRNVIIGESLARVLENAGAEIIRTNYQGDVGLHVAKCFWGMKNNKQAQSLKLKTTDEKVNYLTDCYVAGDKAYQESENAQAEIQEFNKSIYAMSGAIKQEWEEKRQWSLDKFKQIFQRVGTEFDRYYFESEMFREGIEKCQEAQEKGVLIEDDNCLIFDGDQYGLNKRVFINKKGLPTYEGKELALAFKEFTDFGELTRVIHVVANEQINFFRITFLVEKLLDEKLFDDKQFHLPYGLVNLKNGKMSSRKGNVILGEEIIERAKKEVLKLLREDKTETIKERKQIAENVAVGAVKYSFLAINPIKDISFDLKESVRMDGRSGPYIMYSYVRAVNLLKRLLAEGHTLKTTGLKEDILCKEGERLVYCLSKFPNLTKEVAQNYQLSLIASYAYSLASIFANFYDKCPVINQQDKDLQQIRIGLVTAFKDTLGRCLDLLGIKRIEKM
ncbi:MAG: arginine--tRNA ligase [Patescibacteria group bacterium]|nr:arginine--tRNA ligase [Patescibacteria group bacterium]